MEFEIEVTVDFFFPALSIGIADLGGCDEQEHLQIRKMRFGGRSVVGNFLKSRCDRRGQPFADFLRCQPCGRVGIKAEILLALPGDEFGPSLLSKHYG
ncbi:hypothetical protein ADU20_17350 [Burkholderia pseudomallei]|nr:hypothetical protein ADU20_17350 [Burkholderia pseudomallei]